MTAKSKLLDVIDGTMVETSQRLREYRFPKEVPTMWPTDSSIQWITKDNIKITEGSCLRAVWYRLKEFPEEPVTDPRMHWIWALGHWFEKECQNHTNIAKNLIGKNVRIRQGQFALPVSGEMDAIYKDEEGKMFVVDYKTTGGNYHANTKILGNTKVKPFPKIENLLQIMVYLNSDPRLSYGKLVYLIRDRMERKEFNIKLSRDPKSKLLCADVEGVLHPKYSIEEINRRYRLLAHYYKNNILPPRDYDDVYPDYKVPFLFEEGEIGKTKYNNHLKGKKAGHWRCEYCNFKEQCKKDGTESSVTPEDKLND